MFINSNRVELLKLSVSYDYQKAIYNARIPVVTNTERELDRKLTVSELSFSDPKELDSFIDSLIAYRHALSISYLGGE